MPYTLHDTKSLLLAPTSNLSESLLPHSTYAQIMLLLFLVSKHPANRNLCYPKERHFMRLTCSQTSHFLRALWDPLGCLLMETRKAKDELRWNTNSTHKFWSRS